MKMFLNKDRQKFIKAVTIIIGLQGVAWCALSIAGIVVYFSPPDKLKNDIHSYERYIEYLSRIIYDEFMGGERNRVIRPNDFVAFLWIYTILSALWIAVSADQCTAIIFKKTRQSIMPLVLGVIILVTSLIDLVFVSLLARDLDTCPFSLIIATESTTETTSYPTTSDSIVKELTSQNLGSSRNTGSTFNGTPIDCQLANGIILTVAARGFVLWVINVVLAISLIIMGTTVLRTPALLTYEKNTIPRVKTPDFRNQSSPTAAVFLGDNDIFTTPTLQQNGGRNRNSTPVALNNKNQTIYY